MYLQLWSQKKKKEAMAKREEMGKRKGVILIFNVKCFYYGKLNMWRHMKFILNFVFYIYFIWISVKNKHNLKQKMISHALALPSWRISQFLIGRSVSILDSYLSSIFAPNLGFPPFFNFLCKIKGSLHLFSSHFWNDYIEQCLMVLLHYSNILCLMFNN